MAAIYNIKIEQGADYALALTVKDGDGTAVNLTGAVIKAQIKTTFTTPVVAEFSVTVTAATQGKFTLSLSGAMSDALVPFNGIYDVLLIRSNGTRQRVVQGSLSITPAVSHV